MMNVSNDVARYFLPVRHNRPHVVGVEDLSQNVAVEPPGSSGIALAVALARNPASGGTLRVLVALASSTEPAELSLVDVRGRVVAHVAASAGELTLGRGLAPGVYHVRLVQGGRVAVARAVVL